MEFLLLAFSDDDTALMTGGFGLISRVCFCTPPAMLGLLSVPVRFLALSCISLLLLICFCRRTIPEVGLTSFFLLVLAWILLLMLFVLWMFLATTLNEWTSLGVRVLVVPGDDC